MKLPDKVYDVLKWVALVGLNAVSVCYKTCATIWGWPYGEQVLNTCAAVALMIGVLIGVSQINYNADKIDKGDEE